MRIDKKVWEQVERRVLGLVEYNSAKHEKFKYTLDEVREVVMHMYNEYNIQVIKEYEEFMSRKEQDRYSLSDL